jgi:hypothetical protein
MFGTYQRLNVHVWASNREVIRATASKFRDWRNPAEREARKHFYRVMLMYHKDEQDVCLKWRL